MVGTSISYSRCYVYDYACYINSLILIVVLVRVLIGLKRLELAGKNPILHRKDPVHYVDANLVDGSRDVDSNIVASVR